MTDGGLLPGDARQSRLIIYKLIRNIVFFLLNAFTLIVLYAILVSCQCLCDDFADWFHIYLLSLIGLVAVFKLPLLLAVF